MRFLDGCFGNTAEKKVKPTEIKLTFLFKCEVFCQVSTLVIATKQEQGGWMAQLQSPQVDNALKKKSWNTGLIAFVLPNST